MSESCC